MTPLRHFLVAVMALIVFTIAYLIPGFVLAGFAVVCNVLKGRLLDRKIFSSATTSAAGARAVSSPSAVQASHEQ
jgi:hypothetical protein